MTLLVGSVCLFEAIKIRTWYVSMTGRGGAGSALDPDDVTSGRWQRTQQWQEVTMRHLCLFHVSCAKQLNLFRAKTDKTVNYTNNVW